jgi:hypothetical protein
MISFTNLRKVRLARAALVGGLVALPIAGCAASAATLPQPGSALAQASAHPPGTGPRPIDHLTAVAKRRYAVEVRGGQAQGTLHRVARDPVLRSALASGNRTKLRTYVRGEFNSVWYHWHVSRLRIVRGTSIVVDVGVPFVVAPSQMTLRDSHGASLGTLQVSIQDVIGFVRYMHRNYPVDVVVRGQGAAHVRTSLPAALSVRLPDSGTATVSGTRYQVRSFTETALGGEPVKVWILQRG